MKDQQSSERKDKKYLFAFVAVTALNLMLGAFLIHKSFGQTSKYADQKPLTVEVTAQNDSPLRITFTNIDNSASSFQSIDYAVQNVSSKPIIGYVIWAKGKNTGKIATNFFPTKSFQANVIYTEDLFVERENVKTDEVLSILVDYVEFEDGSSWGNNAQGQSEHITGGRAGVKAAAEQLYDLISNKKMEDLTAILNTELVDIEVPFLENAPNDKWRNGFRSGYKSTISFLKNQRGKNEKELLEKLNEVKKNIQIKGGQKQ